MGKSSKKTFFKQFFKSGLWIASLLFTLAICTVIIVAGEYEFAKTFDVKLRTYFISVFGYFCIMLGAMMLLNAKSGKPNLNDAFSFAVMLSSIFYNVYFFLIKRDLTIARFVLSLVFFFFALLCIFIGAIVFKSDYTEPTYKKNSIHDYYNAMATKHPPILVFLFAVFLTCGFYTLLKPDAYSLNFTTTKNIVLAVCLIPVVLYLATGVSDHRVNLFDSILTGCILAIPPIHMQFLFTEYPAEYDFKYRLTYTIVGIALILFFTILRYVSFDFNYKQPRLSSTTKRECNLVYYFKRFSEKYKVLLSVAVGSSLAIILFLLFRYTHIGEFFIKTDGKLNIIPDAIPFAIVTLPCYLILIVGAIMSFLSIQSKKITAGDFTIVMCLSFTIFSFVTMIAEPTKRAYIVLIAILIYCITILGTRIGIIGRSRKEEF